MSSEVLDHMPAITVHVSLKGNRQPAPWLYLVRVTVWSWLFLGIAALNGDGLLAFPNAIWVLLGLLGPLIIPAMLIATNHWDPQMDRNVGAFFKRCFDPRRLPWRWYLIIFALLLVLIVLPVLLDGTALREQGLLHIGPPFFLLIGFLAGAVAEPGWRGYALEGLQRRMAVLPASLIVGFFWAIWHLPLFFIAGSYQQTLGVGTTAFWLFFGLILVESPLYAWLYNAAGRVVFAAVLFHGVGNVLNELVSDAAPLIVLAVRLTVMLAVVAFAWKEFRVRKEVVAAQPTADL